jgi:tetratricopeptide (TPR) repeat protein
MRLVNSTLRAQIRAPSPSGVYQDGGVAVPRGVTHTATNKSSGGPMDSMDLEEEAAAALRNSDDDDDESPSSAELLGALREGRALLKEDTVVAYNKALVSFEKALTLARMVGNSTQTRRATRGLAASRRGLGDGKAAIAHLKEVLLMLQTVGDAAGDTDALGAIADIYTEIGDLENAGRYYDLYLDALNREMM